MRRIGTLVSILGAIILSLSGIVGTYVQATIIYNLVGVGGVVIGFLFLPFMYTLAPWYAFFVLGDSLPLVLIYGGGALGGVLYFVGYKFGNI
jgi:hypothetical protein